MQRSETTRTHARLRRGAVIGSVVVVAILMAGCGGKSAEDRKNEAKADIKAKQAAATEIAAESATDEKPYREAMKRTIAVVNEMEACASSNPNPAYCIDSQLQQYPDDYPITIQMLDGEGGNLANLTADGFTVTATTAEGSGEFTATQAGGPGSEPEFTCTPVDMPGCDNGSFTKNDADDPSW